MRRLILFSCLLAVSFAYQDYYGNLNSVNNKFVTPNINIYTHHGLNEGSIYQDGYQSSHGIIGQEVERSGPPFYQNQNQNQFQSMITLQQAPGQTQRVQQGFSQGVSQGFSQQDRTLNPSNHIIEERPLTDIEQQGGQTIQFEGGVSNFGRLNSVNNRGQRQNNRRNNRRRNNRLVNKFLRYQQQQQQQQKPKVEYKYHYVFEKEKDDADYQDDEFADYDELSHEEVQTAPQPEVPQRRQRPRFGGRRQRVMRGNQKSNNYGHTYQQSQYSAPAPSYHQPTQQVHHTSHHSQSHHTVHHQPQVQHHQHHHQYQQQHQQVYHQPHQQHQQPQIHHTGHHHHQQRHQAPVRHQNSYHSGHHNHVDHGHHSSSHHSNRNYGHSSHKRVPVVIKKKVHKKRKIISTNHGFFIAGGTQMYGKFVDIHSCQKACELTPTCFAGDYNPWLKKCFMHNNMTACASLRSHPSITHFKKIPCTVVETSRGLVTLGTQIFKGIEQKGVKSLSTCIKKCATLGGGIAPTTATINSTPQLCFGLDYNFATHTCYFHTTNYCNTAATILTPQQLVPNAASVNILLCPQSN